MNSSKKPMTMRLKSALWGAFKNLGMIAPMLLAIIGLIGLFKTYITPEMLKTLFNGSALHDMLVGIGVGGISVGQPFISYLVGGELLDNGASFYGVTAFILSFVTLGVVQLPLEFSVFGLRFTLLQNFLALLFSFVLAFSITYTLQVLL